MNIGYVNRPAQPASNDAGGPVRKDAPTRTSAPAPAPARNNAPAEQAPKPSEARTPEQQSELSRASVEKLVERISKEIRIERRSLSFTVDDESGKTVVKVIDRDTDEVIRQIPSEELLRVAEAIAAISDQRAAGADIPAGTGLLIQERA
jgi:flagellar protein FlaG